MGAQQVKGWRRQERGEKGDKVPQLHTELKRLQVGLDREISDVLIPPPKKVRTGEGSCSNAGKPTSPSN